MAQKKTQQSQGDETIHYEPARKRRKQGSTKQQPPLTPMIDVTFQLLLYFLLTSTFREDEGQIPGSLPSKGGAASDDTPLKPIRIVLEPRGAARDMVQYDVSNLPTIIQPRELHEVLKRLQKSDEIPVVIKPRADVRWKYVVEAFNAAVAAKYKNIGFAGAG
jgi:biopolymer transport protein ExbD